MGPNPTGPALLLLDRPRERLLSCEESNGAGKWRMVGEFRATVQVKATPTEVYDFLASGANTGMKVESSDPNAMTVSLKNNVGLLRYGEIVDCTVNPLRDSCRVSITLRSFFFSKITSDVRGTVMRVNNALLERFRTR